MRLFAVLAAVVLIFASPGHTATDTTASALDPAAAQLAQGRWALLFVVLPGCPACEHAIRWLGKAQHAHPQILLLAPRFTEELQGAASQVGLPLRVDEGGRMGAALGVRRAPTVVFLLDGRLLGRLDWPFTEDELVRGLHELAAAPREGPWRLLGARVSLGEVRTLAGEHVNLDELPRPLLVLFFNPLCPPCWDALPGIAEISAEIEVVLAVRAAHALTERDRERLRETGLRAVRDDGALAEMLAARVTPTYVILDQEGVICWVHEGIVEQEVLRRAVLAVVSEDGIDE